jgi:hypothetical protein
VQRQGKGALKFAAEAAIENFIRVEASKLQESRMDDTSIYEKARMSLKVQMLESVMSNNSRDRLTLTKKERNSLMQVLLRHPEKIQEMNTMFDNEDIQHFGGDIETTENARSSVASF